MKSQRERATEALRALHRSVAKLLAGANGASRQALPVARGRAYALVKRCEDLAQRFALARVPSSPRRSRARSLLQTTAFKTLTLTWNLPESERVSGAECSEHDESLRGRSAAAVAALLELLEDAARGMPAYVPHDVYGDLDLFEWAAYLQILARDAELAD